MSYVDDLVGRKPEIHSFSQYITNNLADNYFKGLGPKSKYFNRLSRGIEVATQTAAENLPTIIQGLISDRMVRSSDTRVTSGEIARLSEGQQRALILALWSSRIPKINRDGKIDIENTRVYENESYMPPVDLSRASSIPDSIPISKPKRLYELNEETVKKAIEAIAGVRGEDNIPVKDIINFVKSEADKIGASINIDFEKEVRQIIKQIMSK